MNQRERRPEQQVKQSEREGRGRRPDGLTGSGYQGGGDEQRMTPPKLPSGAVKGESLAVPSKGTPSRRGRWWRSDKQK